MFVLDGKNDFIEVNSVIPGYAHTTYRGVIKSGAPEISLKELLVFLDEGNLCFGGRGEIYSNKRFEVMVHTDWGKYEDSTCTDGC